MEVGKGKNCKKGMLYRFKRNSLMVCNTCLGPVDTVQLNTRQVIAPLMFHLKDHCVSQRFARSFDHLCYIDFRLLDTTWHLVGTTFICHPSRRSNAVVYI